MMPMHSRLVSKNEMAYSEYETRRSLADILPFLRNKASEGKDWAQGKGKRERSSSRTSRRIVITNTCHRSPHDA